MLQRIRRFDALFIGDPSQQKIQCRARYQQVTARHRHKIRVKSLTPNRVRRSLLRGPTLDNSHDDQAPRPAPSKPFENAPNDLPKLLLICYLHSCCATCATRIA